MTRPFPFLKRIPPWIQLTSLLAVVMVGIYGYNQSQPSLAQYIPSDPLWVYQSNQLDLLPPDPVLEEPAKVARRWWKLAPKTPAYWFASSHQMDAQEPSYLLFLSLPKSEREVIAFIGGKIATRSYQGHDLLTFVEAQLHAVKIPPGWLISPSIFLLEKALDGPSSTFDAMPLHPKHQFSSLYVAPSHPLANLALAPWHKTGVYYFRTGQSQADGMAPEFLAHWKGQIPGKVQTWSLIPDPVLRVDYWQITSKSEWQAQQKSATGASFFPSGRLECWQFFPKGETSIVWLPIRDPQALAKLSGGQPALAGIYPLVLPQLAEQWLREKFPAHRYFVPIGGGIALSETSEALQWYLAQQVSGISLALNPRFKHPLQPQFLPRQSRFTLTFPDRGPSFLLWEGMNPPPGEPVVRLTWGKIPVTQGQAKWQKQATPTPLPPLPNLGIRQDSLGYWWLGTQKTSWRTPPKAHTWATWHPKEGLWVAQEKSQELVHVNSQRSFVFSGDARLAGLVQPLQGKTQAVTQFGHLIPLDPQRGPLFDQTRQMERLSRFSKFRVLTASNQETLIIREDPAGVTWFEATGEKGVLLAPGKTWQRVSYEVLPNNLHLLVLFDGQSHYLYSRDGTWLGQQEIPEKGPLQLRFDAAQRMIRVYTQPKQSGDVWTFGPIDD